MTNYCSVRLLFEICCFQLSHLVTIVCFTIPGITFSTVDKDRKPARKAESHEPCFPIVDILPRAVSVDITDGCRRGWTDRRWPRNLTVGSMRKKVHTHHTIGLLRFLIQRNHGTLNSRKWWSSFSSSRFFAAVLKWKGRNTRPAKCKVPYDLFCLVWNSVCLNSSMRNGENIGGMLVLSCWYSLPSAAEGKGKEMEARYVFCECNESRHQNMRSCVEVRYCRDMFLLELHAKS